MSPGIEIQGNANGVAYNGSHRWGLVVFARVAVILGLWVVGFIAFLVAPLLVLLVAWVVGLAFLALRQRGKSDQPATRPAGTHRFGTRRSTESVPGGDAK